MLINIMMYMCIFFFFFNYEFYYENDWCDDYFEVNFVPKNQSVTMMVWHFDLKKLLHVVTM